MSSEALSGSQKVAAFLLSLDRETASGVLKKMDARVVRDVAAAMAELDESFGDPAALETLYMDLSKRLNATRGPKAAGDNDLLDILEASVGSGLAGDVLEEIHSRRKQERPFRDIEAAPPELITRALREESPAVVAVVLAHVDPALTAKVLGSFDPELALDTVQRMVGLVPPGQLALESVAETLAARIASADGAGVVEDDPSVRLQNIAEVLTFAEKELEQSVLQKIEEDSEQTAEEIREFMFAWTDLAVIDKRAMQKILASIDTRSLAISLKGSPAEVEENVMSNLSTRVKEMVLDERELAGALPVSEVLQARAEVLRAARSLMESGEFSLAKGGEELVS